MADYPKINTLFKRDETTKNIIIGDYTTDYFKTLESTLWECTEKIDGTNIHIDIDWRSENDWSISFHGRTERANIPPHLCEKLHQMFDSLNPNEVFTYKSPCKIQIFGEGYGVKIQKGGNYISNGVDFILFDVRINGLWLQRESLEDVANKLGVKIVPLIGYMTLIDAIEFVKKGYKSTIAENKDYDAEGLVLKTQDGLLDRRGDRIITKLKKRDFAFLEKL
jgi:hypothetical protein